jgi:hypothetical protein
MIELKNKNILEENQPVSARKVVTPIALMASHVASTSHAISNGPLAYAILNGVFKAVEYLTRDQSSFLDSLSRKREIERGSFSAYSGIVASVSLASFCDAFPKFDTPGVVELGRQARQKVGVC